MPQIFNDAPISIDACARWQLVGVLDLRPATIFGRFYSNSSMLNFCILLPLSLLLLLLLLLMEPIKINTHFALSGIQQQPYLCYAEIGFSMVSWFGRNCHFIFNINLYIYTDRTFTMCVYIHILLYYMMYYTSMWMRAARTSDAVRL